MAETAQARPTVEAVVKNWADDLRPANAPSPTVRGPLAWVREDKVAELLKNLKAAGYR